MKFWVLDLNSTELTQVQLRGGFGFLGSQMIINRRFTLIPFGFLHFLGNLEDILCQLVTGRSKENRKIYIIYLKLSDCSIEVLACIWSQIMKELVCLAFSFLWRSYGALFLQVLSKSSIAYKYGLFFCVCLNYYFFLFYLLYICILFEKYLGRLPRFVWSKAQNWTGCLVRFDTFVFILGNHCYSLAK